MRIAESRTQAIEEFVRAVIPTPAPDARVALVSMPFWSTTSPSIQLGLLKATLRQHGIASTVYYLNLPLAKLIGYDFYNDLAEIRGVRLGEWLFAQAAFSPRDDDAEFLEIFAAPIVDVLRKNGWSEAGLLELKHSLVPEYVEACAAAVDWGRYSVVGFTSMFQQNTAALALARRLKKEFPQITAVMGGANVEGEMGLECIRAFPWIDAAVIGEGDVVFPQLVKEILGNREAEPRPGVALRRDGKVLFGGHAPMITDLTKSPPPDYDDFFETGERMELFTEWEGAKDIRLPFESSRGCWWGEKQHCTFCGLNGMTMKFRSKTPNQVLDELAHLSSRYRWTKFQAVDNIMQYAFLEEFCTIIEAEKYDLDIFYELKSNMTRDQVRKLRHAGIRRIQPGIESLSSHMLTLMHKGVKGLHNVETLKWARYYGIYAGWNMLLGFPGERMEDCQQQADWARSISHLQPPDGMARIWLERYSPYYTRQDSIPISNVRPERSYDYVYPADEVDTRKIAYFFDYTMGDTLGADDWQALNEEVVNWRSKWQKETPPTLTYKKAFDLIFIADNRTEKAAVYPYSGASAALYLFCETRRHLSRCGEFLQQQYNETEAFLPRAISEFMDRKLMIQEDNMVLSLALPENCQW